MRFIRSLFQPSVAARKRKELLEAQISLLYCQKQAEYYSNMCVYYRSMVRRLSNDKDITGGANGTDE